MGLMQDVTSGSHLVLTPHPVTCDGQRHMLAQMELGETLGRFLARTVPDWTEDAWEVRINGVVVPYEVMDRVRPKDGTLIEVRAVVGKQALQIIAFAALTYFTFGLGAAAAGGWGAGAAAGAFGGGLAGAAFATAVFVAGSVLINKVLGPKIGRAGGDRDQETVHSLAGARNRARPYEATGLLFGKVKIAPDLLSKPYTTYEADQQYLGMILTPGINVARVEPLYNGDALLSSFAGVQVWHSGFSGMPEQPIPLYGNADTLAGGDLEPNGPWTERTTSPGTQLIQIDIEGLLYDVDKHGTIHGNSVPLQVEYRAVGTTGWTTLATTTISNGSTRVIRRTYSYPVAPGQYNVRVRLGQPTWNEGSGKDEVRLAWSALRSIQPDTATYNGLPRIGIKMQATGQLNGTPDELRCVAHSEPAPVWKGSTWVTEETSNPGAQILAYARGFASGGQQVGGMGLSDDRIDIEALQGFMLHCAAEGYTYDYWLTEARSHDEVLNSIARAGFGQISWASGRLSVVWAAQEQPLSGVVNMATIKKGSFQVDYTLANAADGIEATWFDAEEWTVRTLRVPAPGVATMLNPAQLQLEGVTSEAHAAQLARWHLAQSLYQYKDISYATDLEHLSYRRLSMLALQHDLTQWGYGGRVRAAAAAGGAVTLTLDEEVPAPPAGNAFIGLRIPGERVYRVFQIQPFEGTSKTVTLAGAWPADAALPGDSEANPAHDTIWIYDFKQTPGLRVRVVAIEPESDLKGARVAVVPEGPEFWNYVKTGEYIPAAPGSLLQTRPVASQLRITEQQVTQGDTVFTELSATFEVDGPYARAVVFMADAGGVLEEVAQTTTRRAAWRIPRAGTYTIVVRPFSPDGNAGVAASTVYTTLGADAPPVLVDLFDVEQRSGGVRLYTWGWLDDTIQSANFAGVEIRYIEGEVASPTWDSMMPLGETGYFTAPFEAVVPASGTWTFACRSRNTSGTLSTGMRVITRTLAANLGQVIGGIEESLDEITQRQVDEQMRLDQAIADQLAGDLATAAAAAADATAKANAALAQAMAAVNALAADVGEITGAPEWDADVIYEPGFLAKFDGGLYSALVQTQGDQPDISPTKWKLLGEYASYGEAVAAALDIATQNASDIEAAVTQINAMYARFPTGTGNLASEAYVVSQASALSNAISAQATRVDGLVARMPAGNGALATQASVNSFAQASVDRDGALSQRIDTVTTTANGAASTAGTALQAANSAASVANSASVTAGGAQSAATNALNVANGAASAVETVSVRTAAMPNLLTNPTGALGFSGWAFIGGAQQGMQVRGELYGKQGRMFAAALPSSGAIDYGISTSVTTPAAGGQSITFSGDMFGRPANGISTHFELRFYNASNVEIGAPGSRVIIVADAAAWKRYVRTFVAPAGTESITVIARVTGTPNAAGLFVGWSRLKLERYGAETVYSEDASVTALSEVSQGIDGRLRAKLTHVLDVNGNISGTVSENDGVRSSYSILATVFRVISTLTGMGMEWQNGYLRIWKGSAQLILGHTFGSGDLVFWYGPNVGAGNCTKANGTIWFDTGGSAYFGGTLSAGVLKNAARSTVISPTAFVEVGPFSTNGGQKVVNWGMSFANSGFASTNPGNATNSGTLVLERSLNSGASWTQVSTLPISGNRISTPEGGQYQVTIGASASGTFTDNSTSTANFMYRVRIASATGFPANIGGSAGEQSTYVISIEQ